MLKPQPLQHLLPRHLNPRPPHRIDKLWDRRIGTGQVEQLGVGDARIGHARQPADLLRRQARQLGVKQFAIPQTGRLTAREHQREKQPWFKQGQRFRNGIEGRISVVRRTVQLTRCPNRGLDGFERWIGWGIIVANLVVIARKLHNRRRGSKRQAK